MGGWLILRILGRRLGGDPADARRALRAVVEGDLATPVHVPAYASKSLVAEIGHMQSSLRDVVQTIHGSADQIASAATQIASGNHDLSHRTEQAASDLRQTTQRVEELLSSVHATAKTAQSASDQAQRASDIAARGGQAVGEVVETMSRIEASSKKIEDIIAVIDSIAFQTNILALNAAVEAARAGEQGRGFAVVATEVRALAQRSAGAAREIKGLIGSSVSEVSAGMDRVRGAGRTMEEIVEGVNRVTALIRDISTAAKNEASEIEQLTSSIGALDNMTQQNATLVEQSAASAQSMAGLADQLVATVGRFRLRPS